MRNLRTLFVVPLIRSAFVFLALIGNNIVQGQSWPTASQQAANMTLGWNIGNTMEVPKNMGGETGWGNPMVTSQLVSSVKAAGFNTIRIPLAWNSYANSSNVIEAQWLARVKVVVDYCIANNMYVIINSHWDGGWLEENPTYNMQNSVNVKHRAYWTQIANYFKNYDSRLIFAGTNEVRANYGTPTSEHITVQQSYNQTFVNAVRETGGNNLNRNLIVQTYNTNVQHGLNYFTLPTDVVNNRLMVEIHYYDPYEFALDGNSSVTRWEQASWGKEAYVDALFAQMKSKWVNNGVPVLMGEFGVIHRKQLTGSAYQQHAQSRQYWLQYITTAARTNGIIPVYWDNGYDGDNGFALFNRSSGAVVDQGAVDALVAGAASGNVTTPGTIQSGKTYRLTPRHSGKAIEVSNCATNNGANVQQWQWLGNNCQMWIFTDVGNNYWRISPANASSKAVDVWGWSQNNGANLALWDYHAGANQQWLLIDRGQGYYSIQSRLSNKCFDVSGVSSANGANLVQWTCNQNSANQQFLLTEIGLKSAGVINQQEVDDDKLCVESVFPNPVTDGRIYIDLCQKATKANVTIWDMRGVMVYNELLVDSQSKVINIELDMGVYILQIEDENRSFSQKIIVK